MDANVDECPSVERAGDLFDYWIRLGMDGRGIQRVLNLLDYAHGIEDDDGREDASIVGGPSWLDFDRFDVAALVPSLQTCNPRHGPAELWDVPPQHERRDSAGCGTHSGRTVPSEIPRRGPPAPLPFLILDHIDEMP